MARSYDFQRKEDEDKKERESSKSSPRGRQNVTIPADLAAQGFIDFPPFGAAVPQIPGGPEATTIAYSSGNNQSAIVGSAPTNRLEVIVTDAAGAPVQGQTVSWSVSGDAGIDATSVSGIDGVASANLVFGTVVGSYTVQASASGLSGSPVSFSGLTALVGPAFKIEATSLINQIADKGTQVAAIPTVVVTDELGNPVEGTVVSWAVTSGGGSVGDASDDTDSSGVSDCTSWTLGATAGGNTVTATVAGLIGSPVTFSADGVTTGVGTPTTIALTGGSGQTPTVNTAASPLTFTVTDGTNPVQGVLVTFAVTTGSATLSVGSVATDASGQAATTPTVGTVSGSVVITASFEAVAGTVSATGSMTAVAGAATVIRKVTAASSNGVSGQVWTQQPSAEVRDAFNNRVLTATDNITLAINSGNGLLSGTLTVACVNGFAQWTDVSCTGTGDQQLRISAPGFANVNIGIITLAPPIADHLVEVQPGTACNINTIITPDPSVRIADSNNVTIPNDTSAVTVSLSGAGSLLGTLTRNAVTGVATFPGLSITAAGAHALIYSRTGLVNSPLTGASFDVTDPNAVSAHPHEPAGFTQWTLLDGTDFPSIEDGWGTNGNGRLSLNPKTTFDRATSTTVKINYTNWAPGTGPITTWKNLPQLAREIYIDFDYCMQSDYLANAIYNKFFFFTCPNAGSNPLIFGHDTNSYTTTAPAFPSFHLQGAATFVGSGNSASGGNREINNINGVGSPVKFVTRDAIIRHEIYLKMNSPGDVADGIVRLWSGVNGATPTLRIEATDVAFTGTGDVINTNKWTNFKLAPTYGGTSGGPGAGYQRLGYTYASYKL